MTIPATAVSTLDLNQIAKRISQYLRRNPATVFILAFQMSPLVAAVELIDGNIGGANKVGVYAFVALVIGVAFHAISVINGSKEGKTSP